MSEHDEQVAVVRWFKIQYPRYKDCILSIPNGSVIHDGGKKGMGRLKWMIAEGFKSGASDIFIAVPNDEYSGFWLEMKNVGVTYSKVSKPQREFIETMKSVGYRADWAAGFDKASEMIKEYMCK